MTNPTPKSGRRNFLKNCGLSTIPFLVPAASMAMAPGNHSYSISDENNGINFYTDGLAFQPAEYLRKLTDINKSNPIQRDFYGNGGVTAQLEKAFAEITGKEKAIFVPSGTMANELALKLLSGDNTKVLVPENSHIFRDEADAAQAVHGKRLVPVGKGKSFFNLQDLKDTIAYYNSGEVFKSGIGTVTIENPVRRAEGRAVPINTIKAIAEYCKSKGYKMHLDGARLHIASAFTGVSISEYAAYFDTVYISLYKYLNSGGGAILCGDAETIDKMGHQIKIHGGAVFSTWNHCAMALHYLNGIEDRWKKVVETSDQLFSALNNLKEINISKIENGTNRFDLKVGGNLNLRQFAETLFFDHHIGIPRLQSDGTGTISVNESILRRPLNEIIDAFKMAIKAA